MRLHRGASKGHRHYEDALLGNPICADISFDSQKGNIDELVELHQISIKPSPIVSWSQDVDIARKFANEEGIILVLDIDFESPFVVLPIDFPNYESEVFNNRLCNFESIAN